MAKKKLAPTSPPSPPPQKCLYLGYKSSSTGGVRESDEPFSCRSPTYVSVTFTSLSRESATFFGHNIYVTDEVYDAKEVYLVVVRYSDGDSFGTSYGNWTVWAATASEDEALKIAASIEDGSLVREAEAGRKKNPKDPKVWVSIPWDGHFSSLEGVEIHSFRVTQGGSESSSRTSIHRH